MFSSIVAIATLALASSVSAQRWGGGGSSGWNYDIDTGSFCCYEGLRHCQQDQGDWGCVQINGGGPNCVDQTKNCDDACLSNGLRYAYQRTRSNDYTCVCTDDDASQQAYWC